MPEINRKEYAILRILGTHSGPLGASLIARELQTQGIDLTERAIRYHLQALDAAGLTQNLGRSGRALTDAGRAELANARVADQVALAVARIETLAYQTSFDPDTGRGTVVLNLSLFRQADFESALKAMRPVFHSRYATSDLIAVFRPGQHFGDREIPRGMVGLGTVCAITVNGVLLSRGIPVQAEFGGLMEIAGHEPVRFTEIVRYSGTSVDPVEIFIKSRFTSVGEAAQTGRGKVGAGFRLCPAVAREHLLQLIDQMAAWRLRGVVAVGTPGRALLEMEVGVGRMGFVMCAGLNPVAVAEEAGLATTNMAMATLFAYEDLDPVD